jgi:hypothetical protein
MIAAGVIAVFVPALAGAAVTAIVGSLLIFSGLLHVAFAWRASKQRTVLWEILLGVNLRRCGHLSLGESAARSSVADARCGNLPVRRGARGIRSLI